MNELRISHYRVIEKLGAGGMGEVFLAEDTRLERRVALKLLPLELVSDADRRRRFTTEARAASALSHPHVCVIYEVGEADDGRPFLAMEYVEGQTLDARVRERPFSPSEVAAVGKQIADALDAAHGKGIVHRDIKPANISLNERGQVKVLDFGLAKRLRQPAGDYTQEVMQTQSGQILGTPNYMSPEQALAQPVDHRSDLFSLGVVLYEMVAGRPPFAGSSLADTINKIVNAVPAALARFNYEVTPELERIILKCLQKQPDRRYQSARELFVDLSSLNEIATAAAVSATIDLSSATATAELKDSDIFVSCAQLDDQPLAPGKEGWVSQFQRNLKVRLEQLSGEPVKLASRPMPPGPAPADRTLYEDLSKVGTLVSIVSPPFAHSEGCKKGVEEFWETAERSGNLWVEDKPRLFKVVKAPIAEAELSPSLGSLFQQLIPYEFFERDPDTGRFREFDEAFGDAARQRYYERIYDLAYEIATVLRLYRNLRTGRDAALGDKASRIYLAETTSDLQADRDRLKRELLEQGHAVLPDRPLPLIAGQLDEAVRAYLESCDLAIHLVGERYGLVPEDAELSIVAQQNRLAAEASAHRSLERVIWLPRTLTPRDDRQAAFVRQLIEDPAAHRGAEVIQDTLENLKEILEERWRQKEQAPAQGPRSGPADVPRVYLICDRQDEATVEPLEDYLFEQGIEVSLPDFEHAEAAVSQVHLQNLEDCDAALVYYGAGGKSWVDFKLRDLLKAAGYRGGRKIDVQAVYVAPPLDRRKERFKTLTAEVYRASGETFEPAVLAPFVARVKELKQA